MINIKRVGEIIARNRKELSMTQTQLGEVLKVSHQAVSKWERGVSLPDIDILVRLAKIFNNTVDYFLTPEENDAHTSKTNILNNKDDLWKSVLEKIKDQISQPSFDRWFTSTTAIQIDNTLIISGQDPFATDWLYQRYSHMISKTIDEIRGDNDLEVTFLFSEGTENTEP
ncbi:helix-turn-helix domain-containing protein [Paenibacillus sp. FSL R5-0713]|uniref:helix-turn-helix domain-containing protein n=1 Tax=Paenibacillus sp. FSL R5-0713 TaxID=2921655 RepID=UPI0030DA3BD0